MNYNDIYEMSQKIDKLKYTLEYDLLEVDRAKQIIENIIGYNIDEFKNCSIFSKLLNLYCNKGIKTRTQKRRIRYSDIRSAISEHDDEDLIDMVCNTTSLFELQENTADLRYEVIRIAKMPNAGSIVGTLVKMYNSVKIDTEDLYNVCVDIKKYLDNNFVFYK